MAKNKEMSRGQEIIIIIIIILFIIAMIFIIAKKNKKSWISEVKSSDNYEIYTSYCNNNNRKIDSDVLDIISNNWKSLSDNGPWTGNESDCYETFTINYEKNSVIQSINILIIDDSSVVLEMNNNSEYYTRASKLIDELESLDSE